MGAVSRAAEGYDRRAFTVSEVLRMQEAGVFAESERFELIEGEIVVMQAKGPLHETIKAELNVAIVRAMPDHIWMAVEPSVYLTEDTFVDPDIIVFPRSVSIKDLKGSDILLLIEVSASSLTYDSGVKRALYAKHKVQEYWIIDVYQRTAEKFLEPFRGKWKRRETVGPGEALTHPLLPGFSLRLSDF